MREEGEVTGEGGAVDARVQCVAVCCSVLQCIAVCCSVLQCVAVRKNTFREASRPR